MSSLKRIEEWVNHDLRKACNKFTREVAKLNEISAESRKQAKKMRGRREKFVGLKESIDGLKLAFKHFLSGMKDLRPFVATDLTASGYTEAVYVQ